MVNVLAEVRAHAVAWLRGVGGEDGLDEARDSYCEYCFGNFLKRKTSKDCHPDGCGAVKKKCTNPKCQCNCCKKKCEERPDSCSAPAPQPPVPSPDAQLQTVGGDHSSVPERQIQDENTSTTFTPNPHVIAAVIVAIILLDLCIFRFPVGRNIRDFFVRKIPFCIAFYS